MPRKIIFIIIGALLFLALLALLWFWLLHRSPAADTGSPSGFATSSDRGGSGSTSGVGGNSANNVAGQSGDYMVTLGADGYLLSSATGEQGLPAGNYRISQGGKIVGTYALGTNAIGKYILTAQGIGGSGTLPDGTYTFTALNIGNSNIGGTITAGSGIDMSGTQGSSTISTGSSGTTTTRTTTGTTTGAWLGSNTSERVFSATDISSINDPGTLSGTPLVSTTAQSASLTTSGLVLGLTAAGCLAKWAANQLISTFSDLSPSDASLVVSVPTYDFKAATQRASEKNQTVWQCIIKSIAQAAIDQITRSIVTWINSGFNGSPSFVTNFNQYFANVADQAAGEFIKSSAFSFLCSPFASQIKIAIANSYANRNNIGGTCSLTKVTSNVNSFLKGNWSSGGWGGMLQMTSMPSNNPYGAYAYAQIGLNGSVSNAQNNSNRNVSTGGFISVQKCDSSKGQSVGKGNCTVSTPGQVAQDALKTSQDSSINQLNIAQDIDAIVSALTNQLILKTLYGGLSSANNGVTNVLAAAVDEDASNQAKALLATLQTYSTNAVQFGTSLQGAASDIQQVQNNYNTLYNCWQSAASSTKLSATQQASAAQSASAADAQITQLESQISALNSDIERSNSVIATILDLKSQVLFASTASDVTSASNSISNASASFITSADVTTAQQNRTTLQSQLTTTNQAATTGLAQCRALIN